MADHHQPHSDRPPHLIAEAAAPTIEGWQRLVDFLSGDPAAFGAWCRHDSRVRPDQSSQHARRSKPAILADALDRPERDAQLDGLLLSMATATPAGRIALAEMATRLHTAEERHEMRTRWLRQLREVHYKGVPARKAARLIYGDLAHRVGVHIRSTGSAGKDQLCDRTVLTGLATGEETIRKLF